MRKHRVVPPFRDHRLHPPRAGGADPQVGDNPD